MDFIKRLRHFSRDELLRGSIILLILINIGNIINYLYQFIMARMLGPVDYGILSVLVSLTYIFGIPTIAIQTVMSKNIAKLNVNKEYGKMKGLFSNLLNKLFFASVIIFLIFSILAFFFAAYLDISFWLLVLAGTLIITSFIYPIAAGTLQGMKKFSTLGWNIILVFGVKLFLAIILVMAGFKVFGAILGFIFGAIIGFVFAIPYIKEVIYAHKQEDEVKILTKDNTSTFIAMLIIVLIYSVDVILAKIFFPAELTGEYAVISLIGKIVLFSTMSIGSAMFPISAERHHAGGKTHGIIRKASLAIFSLSIISVALFILFPNFIIGILFGSQYLSLAGLLVYMGVAFSFIAFLNLLVLYRISVDEFNMAHVGLLSALFGLQIVLLSIFHSTITEFSIVFMISTIVTFIGAYILVRKW